MIQFQVTVIDATTNAAIIGAAVNEKVSWGGFGLEKAGSSTFSGVTDGQGYYTIQLSDIGFGDTPYSISGTVSASNYYDSTFTYAQINGNADGHQINKTVYLTEINPINPNPSPTNPTQGLQNLFSGPTFSKLTSGSSESMVVWIIALVIMISVIIIIFLMRGKMGSGATKPRAVIY